MCPHYEISCLEVIDVLKIICDSDGDDYDDEYIDSTSSNDVCDLAMPPFLAPFPLIPGGTKFQGHSRGTGKQSGRNCRP